jgi:hypothetical protein
VFPRVTFLVLNGTSVRRLTRDDLAGFPSLEELVLHESKLEELDPDILQACPALRTVHFTRTPLASDAPRLAGLRARWPGISLVTSA